MNLFRRRSVVFRLSLAVLVALALAPSRAVFAQAPPPTPLPLDQQDAAKAAELVDAGKLEDAVPLYEGIPKNYPTSPLIPLATLRLGYVYFRLNQYDKAAEALEKVPTLKGVQPDLVEIALSLAPQVISAKAASLKPDAPARKTSFEDAVKKFDVFLKKFPKSDEAESANYGKAVALYQIGKYEDALTALKANLQAFPNSESILDSEYLYALTLGTLANVTALKATAKDPSIDKNYDNAEAMLGDIISKQSRDFAMANDARFQIGEMLMSRASFLKDEAARQKMLLRALEAYRMVAAKDLVLQAQKQRIELIKATRAQALSQTHDLATAKRLARVIEKEQEKLATFQARPEQTIAAKIKEAQIFFQLGRLDETRVLLNFAKKFAEDDEQKKQISYYTALSLASQNVDARGKNKALAEKTMEAYEVFKQFYKADPIAENLALIVGAGFQETNPDLAIKYFKESAEAYPKGKFRITSLTETAVALTKLEKWDEALKAYKDVLSQKPPQENAATAEFGIATIYKSTGKVAEALQAFKAVRDKYTGLPEAEQAAYWYGQVSQEKGDSKTARTELENFVKNFPKSALIPDALYFLAQAQAGVGQRAEALASYTELAEKYPTSVVAPFSYFQKANLLMADQKFDDVVATMNGFIKAYPDSQQLFQAYDFVAQIESSRGKDPAAIESYEGFVKAKPQDPAAAQALLRISALWKGLAEKLGRYVALNEEQKKEWTREIDSCIAASEQVVQKYPESQQVALALKNLLDSQKLRQQARLISAADVEKYFADLADKFKDKPSTRSKVIFTLAADLFDKDRPKAIQLMAGVYDPKLRYAPSDLDLYGTALTDQNKLDEAAKVYAKLGKDYPVPANTDPTKASRDVQEAQAMNIFGLGKILQEQKKYNEAKAHFDELEKLYPWSPKMLEANYGNARSLYENKQYDEALKRLIGVIKANTAPPELRAKAMFLLAEIHENEGNYETAIDNYLKIANFYAGVPTVAADGLWRGAQLLEKEAQGKIPMPRPATPGPRQAKASPGAKASPLAKPSPGAKPAAPGAQPKAQTAKQ